MRCTLLRDTQYYALPQINTTPYFDSPSASSCEMCKPEIMPVAISKQCQDKIVMALIKL